MDRDIELGTSKFNILVFVYYFNIQYLNNLLQQYNFCYKTIATSPSFNSVYWVCSIDFDLLRNFDRSGNDRKDLCPIF